jgi:tRNA1Val (adenine37-N6)-methyltransferase
MANNYFQFKQFTIRQERSAFRVGTDGVLLGACADISRATSILDIGTGTGLLALMLAQRCSAIITAIEPDYESYLQACENIDSSPWKTRINLVNTDLQSFDPGSDRFDLIVSNPPFFTDSLKNPDPRKSGARHNDSLTTPELIQGSVKLLTDSGQLNIIMPYVEGNILIAEAVRFGLYCNNVLKIRPLPTSEIRRLILKFSKIRENPKESFLTIEHGMRHEFTEDYINLTKDFYLKF